MGSIEEENASFLNVHKEVAKAILGNTEEQSKQWIGDETWRKVQERKDAKLKMENARSERLKAKRREEYKPKDKEVNKYAREDRRKWLE